MAINLRQILENPPKEDTVPWDYITGMREFITTIEPTLRRALGALKTCKYVLSDERDIQVFNPHDVECAVNELKQLLGGNDAKDEA